MQLDAAYRLDCLLKWWPAHLQLMLVESLEHMARAKNDLPMLQEVTAWRLRAQMAEQEPQEPDGQNPSSIS
jgi:hypothetical protein